MAEVMTHTPDCHAVDLYVTRGRHGDLMIRCRGCGRFTLDADQNATPKPATPRPTAPRPSTPKPTPAPPGSLRVPPVPLGQRCGSRWPTHKDKARRKRSNRAGRYSK